VVPVRSQMCSAGSMMSPVQLFNRDELATISRCLEAANREDVIPEWEFQTLFGIERSVLEDVLARWSEVDLWDEPTLLAVNNALVNIACYPHALDVEALAGVSETTLIDLARRLPRRP